MRRILHSVLVPLLLVAVVAMAPPRVFAALDYAGMVDRIDAFLNEAVTLYRVGDAEGAKIQAQRSYFEVFENLEGPGALGVRSHQRPRQPLAGWRADRAGKPVGRSDPPRDATATTIGTALSEAFAALPPSLRRSLACDRGREMACHETLSKAACLPVLFA